MNIVVGVEPVTIPWQVRRPGPRWGGISVTIQNLGAGVVYVDYDPAVTVETGIRIEVAQTITLPVDPGVGPLYLIASVDATDVRYF